MEIRYAERILYIGFSVINKTSFQNLKTNKVHILTKIPLFYSINIDVMMKISKNIGRN